MESENSGESGIGVGVAVEKVDVKIGAEGAKATLIGWGDSGFNSDAAKKPFPLRIGPLAQYNLLYTVSFLRSPDEMGAFSFVRAAGVGGPPQSDLQRAVTINIFGNPYIPPRPSRHLPYYALSTHSLHDGTAPSTSQHTKPSLGRHGRLRSRRRAPQHPS